jgi:hypothetical protein
MARWWHSTARAGRTSASSECAVGTYTMPRSMPLDRGERSATATAHLAKAVANKAHSRHDDHRLSGVEGIVAKLKADPYTPETVWYKVKNRAYTQAEGRWELFEKRR